MVENERASIGITSATKSLLDGYKLMLVNGDVDLAKGISYDKAICKLLKKDA